MDQPFGAVEVLVLVGIAVGQPEYPGHLQGFFGPHGPNVVGLLRGPLDDGGNLGRRRLHRTGQALDQAQGLSLLAVVGPVQGVGGMADEFEAKSTGRIRGRGGMGAGHQAVGRVERHPLVAKGQMQLALPDRAVHEDVPCRAVGVGVVADVEERFLGGQFQGQDVLGDQASRCRQVPDMVLDHDQKPSVCRNAQLGLNGAYHSTLYRWNARLVYARDTGKGGW